MEDMASLWDYEEGIEELKQKLLYTNLQLESVRAEANEEMRKNMEYVKQLVQFIKIACHERDEARDNFQKLLHKVMSPNTPIDHFFTNLPQILPESLLLKPTKANSSISESNSLPETYNYQSHGSSPVDSLFDAVSSPELSNINSVDPINTAFGTVVSTGLISSGIDQNIDQASLKIDGLVKGKTLPQKGKLLQAVLEAGPLLQTLCLAGQLPRWRNPPPFQAFQIPPVSIKGYDAETVSEKPAPNSSHFVPVSFNSQSYVEMSCGSSQLLSTSMLNFDNGASGSCIGNGGLISACANTSSCFPAGKRQRLQ